MKRYLVVILFFLLFSNCKTHECALLVFEKKSNNHSIKVKMPTNCWILTKSGQNYRGEIISQKDSVLRLNYYKFDTIKITEVSNNKNLSNKIRNKLIDSIIKSDSTFVLLDYSLIEKINIGKASIKGVRYKISFFGAGILYLAASGLCFATIMTTAGEEKHSVVDMLKVLSFPASCILWLSTTRKNIKTDEWKLKIIK